ncbi:hypothetical protein [Mammaliicoccus sciuri]|uniref:hypothetical protein n=1 Tax=Mammaliicoccus sciuri TaxID=1296 RepID=UPI001E606241|nr:hypothetical protein [Mammaliicoccus sciuri]MCD8770813.1 hypothetical protein [Mammaliicoccus sciuri]
MKFKAGDRVHVTRLVWKDVDFYATLQETNSFLGHPLYRLVNCTNFDYQNYLVRKENSDLYGVRDYYTLAADEEDTEEPVIQRVEDIKRYIPDTKNLIESAFEEIEQSIYNFNQSKVNNQKVELDNHYIIEVKKDLYVEEVGSDNHFKFTKDITKAKIYEVNESTVRQYAELLDGRILNLKRYIEV